MVDGTQDKINLHTGDGSTGYRIVKFEVFPQTPGTTTVEATLKIYKVAQTTVTNNVDFSDTTLLAAAYYMDQDNPQYTSSKVSVFDTEVFNQDIYITAIDTDSSTGMNYYLELEQFILSDNENTVATLKDIRANA